jgi:hypothetical protein
MTPCPATIRAEGVETRHVIVIFLRLHRCCGQPPAGPAVEVQPFHLAVFDLDMGIALPVTAEIIGINPATRKIARQRAYP